MSLLNPIIHWGEGGGSGSQSLSQIEGVKSPINFHVHAHSPNGDKS